MNSKHLLWKMALLLSCLLASTAAPVELHPIARPITWDSIAECYNQEIPAGSTFRSAEGEERYTQWKEEVKSRNVLIPDFIKESVLGFSNNPQQQMYHLKTADIAGKSVEVFTSGDVGYLGQFERETASFRRVPGISKDDDFMLVTRNKYPYDLEEGAQHWLVWSHQHYDHTSINALLKTVFLDDVEWQLYQNAAHLKSIPQISHYQLFLRKRPVDQTDL